MADYKFDGKSLIKTREPEAAMGSALLAAAWAWHKGSVSAAQARMVNREQVFDPMVEMEEPLKKKLEALKKECRQRGYL